MTPREQGFLLLTQTLGDPGRKPLTVAQFRSLTRQAQEMERPLEDRELSMDDLIAIGCDFLTAEHILTLLSQSPLLERYLEQAALRDCCPLPRVSEAYPHSLRQKLGTDSPGCLWAKGDLSLLHTPAIALVGSRELMPRNHSFAHEVGKQAALQGFTLISGNARGADLTAQESCLAHGGKVISVIADRLDKCPLQRSVLYLSEDGFDLPFSPQRALSRNRIIHCLPRCVFVAQVRSHKGGTWSGAVRNLKHGWSPLLCFNDGSEGTASLLAMGAAPIDFPNLSRLTLI